MKELTTYFTKKDIIFKQINETIPKELGSRKKIKIYNATSVDSKYYAIFIVDSKSRFIRKSADDIMILCDKLSGHLEHNFKKKILLVSSPLCSKAKAYLKENKWSVYIDFM